MMDVQDYMERLLKIKKDAEAAEFALAKEYVLDHLIAGPKDVVEDHVGPVRVEKIGFYKRDSGIPGAVFTGVMLTKNGHKPFKSGEKRKVFEGNVQKVNGLEVTR